MINMTKHLQTEVFYIFLIFWTTEWVLFIVQTFAGYSLGEADIFRKAMGKKIPQVMKKERRSFISRAGKNGFPAEVAEEIFNLISYEKVCILPSLDVHFFQYGNCFDYLFTDWR